MVVPTPTAGGEPGNEAHGGYTYCGVSALAILGEMHRLNLRSLLRWTCERQMLYEGGFQGRTNKLVDSCYSFWQSAIFPQIQPLLPRTTPSWSPAADADQDGEVEDATRRTQQGARRQAAKVEEVAEEMEEIRRRPPMEEYEGDWLYDQLAVQAYIYACCQDLDGGLRDKPLKSRDYYHTCYALAGLAVGQHNMPGSPHTCLHGRTSDLLKRIDATYAISTEKVQHAKHYFQSRGSCGGEGRESKG